MFLVGKKFSWEKKFQKKSQMNIGSGLITFYRMNDVVEETKRKKGKKENLEATEEYD